MNLHIWHIVIIAGFIAMSIYGCDNSLSPRRTIVACDTCGNDAPITTEDSLWKYYPVAIYSHEQVVHIQGERVIGLAFSNGWKNFGFNQGVFVYDLSQRQLLHFMQCTSYDLSSDNRKLALIDPLGNLKIADPASMSVVEEYGEYLCPRWSYDNKILYLNITTENRLYSFNSETKEIRFLSDHVFNVKPLRNGNLLAIDNNAIILYDTATKDVRRTPIQFPSHELLYFPITTKYDISMDEKVLATDISSTKGIFNDVGGLYLIEVETGKVKKLRDKQRWGHRYAPTFTEKNTLYVTIFCRKDSVATIHEINLDGIVLRQVTNKNMLFMK